jgi:hypothetical protein
MYMQSPDFIVRAFIFLNLVQGGHVVKINWNAS